MQRRSGRRGTLTHESHSLPKSDAKVPPLSVSHSPKSGARWIWEAPDPAVQVDGPSFGKKDQDPSLRYVFEAGFRLRFTSQSSSIRQGRPQCSIHNTARNTRMQPKTCPSTTSLQKGIDTFPDRANPTRWRLATLAGGVECQDLWGVRFRDAGTGFAQKVADGAIAMPSCATLRGIDTKDGAPGIPQVCGRPDRLAVVPNPARAVGIANISPGSIPSLCPKD